MDDLDRREFLITASLAVLGGAVNLIGCGGSPSPAPEQPPPQPPPRPPTPNPSPTPPEEPPVPPDPGDEPTPSPDPEPPSPQPEPEPEPTPQTIRVQVNFQGKNRSIDLPPNTSVLKAIKKTYGYQRVAPRSDLESPSKIGGVEGHFRYQVDGEEPTSTHAAEYLLTEDSVIDLFCFYKHQPLS